jgi:hypothetical protein
MMEVRVLKAVPRPVSLFAPYPYTKKKEGVVMRVTSICHIPARRRCDVSLRIRLIASAVVAQLVEQDTARCMSCIDFYPSSTI